MILTSLNGSFSMYRVCRVSIVIDDGDHVRLVSRPTPQDQIGISLASPRRKRRDNDSSASGFDQAVSELPGGHGLAIGGQHFPSACEFGPRDQSCCKTLIRGQIEDVTAIDPVAAQGHWLRFESEALLCLEPRGLKAQRCVKACGTWPVEPAAMHPGTLAGFGIERPTRVMRAIYQPFEPRNRQRQANPPCAIRAR